MPSHIELALLEAIRRNLPPRTRLWDFTGTTAIALREPDSLLHADWGIYAEDGDYNAPFFGTPFRDDIDLDSGVMSASIYAQVKIESYRIDLVLKYGSGLLFIECDGHDWHERTKQQAAYDRERDRLFLAQGVVTARFTGSEIVNYPEKCCRELFAIAATSDRIGYALLRNGFNSDGTSFRARPSSATVDRGDGTTFSGHWNPGHPLFEPTKDSG